MKFEYDQILKPCIILYHYKTENLNTNINVYIYDIYVLVNLNYQKDILSKIIWTRKWQRQLNIPGWYVTMTTSFGSCVAMFQKDFHVLNMRISIKPFEALGSMDTSVQHA